MCAVSMIFDYGKKTWDEWNQPSFPSNPPVIVPNFPYPPTPAQGYTIYDFSALQKDIDEIKIFLKEIKKLLEAAEKFDKETGQGDCEDLLKGKFIKKAEKVLKDKENDLKRLRKTRRPLYHEAPPTRRKRSVQTRKGRRAK